ncbi:hypothetical protein BGX23_003302, partial [Mortierella sp. AD031]
VPRPWTLIMFHPASYPTRNGSAARTTTYVCTAEALVTRLSNVRPRSLSRRALSLRTRETTRPRS